MALQGQHWVSLNVQGMNPDEVEEKVLKTFPEADIDKDAEAEKLEVRLASKYEAATVNGKLKEIVGHDTPIRLTWRDCPREIN